MVLRRLAFALPALVLHHLRRQNFAAPDSLPAFRNARVSGTRRSQIRRSSSHRSSTQMSLPHGFQFNALTNANDLYGTLHLNPHQNAWFMGVSPPENLGSQAIADCVLESEELDFYHAPRKHGGERIFLGHNGELSTTNDRYHRRTGKRIGIYNRHVLRKAARFELLVTEGTDLNLVTQTVLDGWGDSESIRKDDFRATIEWGDVEEFKRNGRYERFQHVVVKIYFKPPVPDATGADTGFRVFAIDVEKNDDRATRIYFMRSYLFYRMDGRGSRVRRLSHLCPPHALHFPSVGLEGLYD